ANLGPASLAILRLLFLEDLTVKQTAMRTGLSRCFVKNAEYRIGRLIARLDDDLALNLDDVGLLRNTPRGCRDHGSHDCLPRPAHRSLPGRGFRGPRGRLRAGDGQPGAGLADLGRRSSRARGPRRDP